MNIRKEKDSDKGNIWKVNAEAFETEAEANLLNALRDSGIPFISLVAVSAPPVISNRAVQTESIIA